MLSPGAREVGLELAAFWIAATAGAITGAGVTVSVTGRMSGELVAPATTIEIEPWYEVVLAASPAGLMVTDMFCGVLPLTGETDSQLPPLVVEAVALKAAAPPLAIETAVICGCGLALPVWKLTGTSDVGLIVIVGAFDTVNVTVTV